MAMSRLAIFFDAIGRLRRCRRRRRVIIVGHTRFSFLFRRIAASAVSLRVRATRIGAGHCIAADLPCRLRIGRLHQG